MKLKSITDILEEQLNSINEMAIPRKKAEDNITSLGYQIIRHLIKVLYWEDNVNYNKHIHDINTWLNKIDLIELKPNNRKPSKKEFYDWMYDWMYSSKNQIYKIVKNIDKDYGNLKVINTPENLMKEVKSIYTDLSIDLSEDNLKNIEIYLDRNKNE